MKRALVLVVGMMLASIAPVAAGGDHHCSGTACEPPPVDPVFQVDAQAMVCGDPRLFWQGINTGTVPSVIKVVAYDGKYKTGHKIVMKKFLPQGATRSWGPRWIRGNGSAVVIRAWDPITETWSNPPLLRWKQTTFAPWWGTQGCPANRFGEPDWTQAHHSTIPG